MGLVLRFQERSGVTVERPDGKVEGEGGGHVASGQGLGGVGVMES